MTDSRNVINYYKNWELENIKADLDKRRSELIIMCINLSGDFNKASVVRAGNAFCVKKTIIAGKRRWDPRGSVGTNHYEHIEKWDDAIDAIRYYLYEGGYTVIPVENTPEYNPIDAYKVEFPAKTMLVFGEECNGLTQDIIDACNHRPIYQPQYGSVRSLNVAQSAATMMQLYDLQHSRDHLFNPNL